MSTFNVDPNTDIRTAFLKPTTTAAEIVLTAPTDKSLTVLGMILSNNQGSEHIVTVDRHDGTNVYEVADALGIPGNSAVELEVPVTLERSWTLRYTLAVPSGACITVTYYETPTVIQ